MNPNSRRVSGDSNSKLQALIEGRLPATLDLLRDFVGINSYTGNVEGVKRLGRLTAERFATLGFSPTFLAHRDPGYGDHVVLTRPGTGPRTVALISHLDTVFPPEEEHRNNFRWDPDGDRVFGPGTIDIKGGTAMIHLVLSVLAHHDPNAFAGVQWLVLLNATEEILSDDFRTVCRSRLDPAKPTVALVFEAEGRSNGNPAVVVARKGRATFRITVEGRAAHAGTRHPRGANAITQMGRLVDRIAGFTDYDRHLTFNVGSIQGGSGVNRVPQLAIAEVEMRAFAPETYRSGVQTMLDLRGSGDVQSPVDGHACQVRVEILAECPPWPRNGETDALFDRWRSAADDLGMRLEAEERGGLSDGNWLWDWIPTLDGLGPYGDNDHCSERSADGAKLPEFIHVPSIVPKALLNTVVLGEWIRSRNRA